MAEVTAVSTENEFDQILNSNENVDKLIMVDFHASWCGPCKMIAPRLKELQTELGTTVRILKVDVDDLDELAGKYEITAMPTFIFIKNGEQIDRLSGANYDRIVELVNKHK